MERILLDTNVFNNKELLKLLIQRVQKKKAEVHVNAVVYMELGYIYWIRKKYHVFKNMFQELGVKSLPITKKTAEIAIKLVKNFKDDPRGAQYHFRDCLIGATALEYELHLLTDNKKDFESITTPTGSKEYVDED